MPIKLPRGLPAFEVLASECVSVICSDQAWQQEIWPMSIGLIEVATSRESERAFLKSLSSTPLQIDLHILRTHQFPSLSDLESQSWQSWGRSDHTVSKLNGIIVDSALGYSQIELDTLRDWIAAHSKFSFLLGGGTVPQRMLEGSTDCQRLEHQRIVECGIQTQCFMTRGFSDRFCLPIPTNSSISSDTDLFGADTNIIVNSESNELILGWIDDCRTLVSLSRLYTGTQQSPNVGHSPEGRLLVLNWVEFAYQNLSVPNDNLEVTPLKSGNPAPQRKPKDLLSKEEQRGL